MCGAGSEKQVKSNAICEVIRMILMTKYITDVLLELSASIFRVALDHLPKTRLNTFQFTRCHTNKELDLQVTIRYLLV